MYRIIFLSTILFLFACNSRNSSTTQGVSLDGLKNTVYISDYTEIGRVQLANGKYESSEESIYASLTDKVAFGDINGDGVNDAAAVLATNSGGSGVFIDLAAVIDKKGNPVNVAVTPLGERVKIDSISIANKQIILAMVVHDKDDPLCCPTLKVNRVYELQKDSLVQVK
jgi:hypothetical protein